MKNIVLIDLFCGAGGVTTGVEAARVNGRKIAKVVACVNHDPVAIESHEANHPDVLHFIEDIRTLDVKLLPTKKVYPNSILVLWASLECTNFSNAKGGKPRDADSRTLAEYLDKYVEHINPDYIKIENVREFMAWGPLDDTGKPKDKNKGEDYWRWKCMIESFGYNYDFRLLNSADYGAHTSRIRYFGIFAKHGLPIVFPEPTHTKKPQLSMFGPALKQWKPVKEVLDLQDEGKSIFTRNTELSPKTLERIYAGLVKYVAGGNDAFIAKYYSGKPEGKVISVDGPAGTITCVDGQAIVKAAFITKYRGNNQKTGINSGCSIDNPSPVVATSNQLGIVQAAFLQKYYSGGGTLASVEDVCSTLTTKDRIALVQPKHFIDKQYGSGKHNTQSVNVPGGTLTQNPKLNLVSAWLMNTNFTNIGRSLEEPAPTVVASRRHHYLVNPQWGGNLAGIEKPCFTLIARMDKAPPLLVSTESGEVCIVVYEHDSEPMRKIKEFMAIYGIVDIKMRMLKLLELLKIQGFPSDYELKGSQQKQKKFIGNAVVPVIPKKWMESIYLANTKIEETYFKNTAKAS